MRSYATVFCCPLDPLEGGGRTVASWCLGAFWRRTKQRTSSHSSAKVPSRPIGDAPARTARRGLHTKRKLGWETRRRQNSCPPPKVFPAMRPALFAQALRARGSAVRVWDQAALRDFRGVLFFRRAKMHGDNPARVIGRVRQRGSRCYPANRARSITGPKEPRASVDSAWRCGAPAAVSISLRAASSRSGPEKGLPGLLSENHRPHVVVRRVRASCSLSSAAGVSCGRSSSCMSAHVCSAG